MDNQKVKAYKNKWEKWVIIYLIIGFLLCAGIYFFFFRQKPTPYVSNYNSPTLTVSPSVTIDQENAKKQIENFYFQWLNPPKISSDQKNYKANYITNRNIAVKKYITEKAAAQLNDRNIQYDPATCTGVSLPAVEKFSMPVINGTQASMAVTISYANPTNPSKEVAIDLIKFDLIWLIDSFTCPSQ